MVHRRQLVKMLLKMKFNQQRRLRLAQGLWLLSWLALTCGAFIFCLGVYLKMELLRRSEVNRTTHTHANMFYHNTNTFYMNGLFQNILYTIINVLAE